MNSNETNMPNPENPDGSENPTPTTHPQPPHIKEGSDVAENAMPSSSVATEDLAQPTPKTEPPVAEVATTTEVPPIVANDTVPSSELVSTEAPTTELASSETATSVDGASPVEQASGEATTSSEDPNTAPAKEEKPKPKKRHQTPALPPQPVPTVPPAPQAQDLSRIAQDFQIRKTQVDAVVELLDSGNTVPFITRYRKERTGGLDEDMIRLIQSRVAALRTLAERKQTILKSIAGQGRLNDELVEAILHSEHPKRLEDLYLPFKPKKRSLATDAKEKGLEPLSQAIWTADAAVANLQEVLDGMVNPDQQLTTVEEVITGVRHILAEVIAELAIVRGPIRAFLRDTAVIVTNKIEEVPEGKGQEYRDYFQFREPIRMMPPHRILAVNRGENERILRAKLEWDTERVHGIVLNKLALQDHPHLEFIRPCIEDAITRLLMPSLEREIRKEMAEFAQDSGVEIFARNLRSLLLRAPLGGTRLLAIDPGMKTGCKIAVLDETGVAVEHGVIYPHPPHKKAANAKRHLEQLIRKYQINIVAIGNGTGCRETEQLVADMIAEFENRRINPTPAVSPLPPMTTETPTVSMSLPEEPSAESSANISLPETSQESVTTEVTSVVLPTAETVVTSVNIGDAESVSTSAEASDSPSVDTSTQAVTPEIPEPEISLEGLAEPPADLAYVIVNEAGASDYSASPIAKEEFPDFDATVRGTISIGRRLQDPLAELVKIDPQHVGVGLYQYDMRQKSLKESLEGVIESCVNLVGVDVNTASIPLLRHVSGLNQLVAREIVEYRNKHGQYQSRQDLMQVPQMGENRFQQAAGFLKIRGGKDPLDNTWVHPESYPIALQILTDMGMTPADLQDKTKLAELKEKLKTQNPEAIANNFKVGGPTVRDIFEALVKPGRDIREDRPQPIFRKGVLKLEDLSPGMELRGEILNVVPFGAFIDVGLKDSGLVHISQMANRFIKSPYDVVSVGDVVSVWVMDVKAEEKKISLTMLPPGVERRPPSGPRGEGNERAPIAERAPRERGPRPSAPAGEGRQQYPPRDRAPRPTQGQGPRPSGGGASRGPGQPAVWRGGQKPPAPAGFVPPSENVAAQAQRAAPPPRPQKPKSAPKLSDQQKTGKAALNTFAELFAFYTPPGAGQQPPTNESEKKPEGDTPNTETPKPDTPE